MLARLIQRIRCSRPSLRLPVAAGVGLVTVCLLLWLWLARSRAAAQLQARLVEAVKSGDHDSVRTLLAEGADPNARPTGHATLLELTLQSQDVATARVLLDSGASPNVIMSSAKVAEHALCWALHNRHMDIAEMLLDHSAATNDCGTGILWPPLRIAVQHGSPDEITLLLRHGADVNSPAVLEGYLNQMLISPVCYAMSPQDSCMECLRILIQAGIDPMKKDECGRTALLIAAASGMPEIAQVIANAMPVISPAELVCMNDPAAIASALKKSPDMANMCVESTMCPYGGFDAQNVSLLSIAIEYNKQVAFDVLLQHGAFVDGCDEDAGGPLRVAVFNERAWAVEKLLSRGANPNGAPEFEEKAPLHLAIDRRSSKMLRMLLDSGADPGLSAPGRLSPLEYAAREGAPSWIVDMLSGLPLQSTSFSR